MRDGDAGDVAMAGGKRADVPHEAPEPLGWDGIGAIVILLVAAADLHAWVSDLSVGVFVFRLLWVLIYLAAASRLVQRFGTEWLTWTIRHQPALSALLVLTVASCLWSLAPWLTLQKAASLLGTTVVGVFIGYTCRPQGVMRVLHWTFTVLIVASVVVTLISPASMRPLGWRGIMSYNNSFGAAAALATTFFLVITLSRHVHPIWGAALSTLSLCTVVGSRSRTSFVALGASLIASAYLAVGWSRRRPTQVVVRRMALGLVLGVSVVPFVVASLATVVGDNDPLHGRTHLWAGTLTILRERPLTGYGYAAVWGRSDATFLPHIPITARWWALNAHNSIADVASELGIPGAIIACIYLFGALSNAGRLFERDPSAFAFFALVFLIGMTVMSFTEAHLLRIHSIFWILFVALTLIVQRTLTRGGDGAEARGPI